MCRVEIRVFSTFYYVLLLLGLEEKPTFGRWPGRKRWEPQVTRTGSWICVARALERTLLANIVPSFLQEMQRKDPNKQRS